MTPTDTAVPTATNTPVPPTNTATNTAVPPTNTPVAPSPTSAGLVTLQFLNVSDWHAQLDPSSNVGGASTISTYWKQNRAANPNTIMLTAGDDFGATPPLSGFFNEVPGILAERMMGIQIGTFGNHNFDRGLAFLQQRIDQAGAPTALISPTQSLTRTNGTPFPYVAANLVSPSGFLTPTLTGVERYKIITVGGVKVAVIGLVNPEAPSLVAPGNLGNLTITNPVAAAQQARADALAQGAQVFVVIPHMGVTSTNPPAGPLIDLANQLTGFDIIFGDHTDTQYGSTGATPTIINGALVFENRSKGVTYGKVNLVFDTTTNTVSSKTLQFITPTSSAVIKDQDIEAMLAPYRTQLAAKLDVPMGTAAASFPRNGTIERVGEVALGDLTAEALRAHYGTQLGFTNGGGLRSALPDPSYRPANTGLRRPTAGYSTTLPYDLVLGNSYSVLPFGNFVVQRTVTGAQLWSMLEHSVAALPGSNGRFGQIAGFRFTYKLDCASTRIQTVTLADGTPVPNSTGSTYTLSTNDFTNVGGDGYNMLADGSGTSDGILMADALSDYILSRPLVNGSHLITPTLDGRIAPVASTGACAATNLLDTSATLNDIVNPRGITTTVSFNYGLTTAYGSTTATQNLGRGTTDLPVTANLSGLAPDTIYHYRVVTTQTGGTPLSGIDKTFRTAPAATTTPTVIGPTNTATVAPTNTVLPTNTATVAPTNTVLPTNTATVAPSNTATVAPSNTATTPPTATATTGAGACSTTLFFSEYIEGSSNNKAVEIFNGTGAAVSLTGYTVKIYANGGTTPANTINLTGSVAANDVFVLAHTLANAAILAQADQTSNTLTFNGNDAVVLSNGATVLDVIGQIGVDPGAAGWGTDPANTMDNTIVRNSNIVVGDANGSDAFDPAAEWTGSAVDTTSFLGSHTQVCGPTPTPSVTPTTDPNVTPTVTATATATRTATSGPVCGAPATAIYAVQGNGTSSPLNGQSVTIEGIVTGDFQTSAALSGFYLQEAVGDGDLNTSDGIFVFDGATPALNVQVGDRVRVQGTALEFNTLTEISPVSQVAICSTAIRCRRPW